MSESTLKKYYSEKNRPLFIDVKKLIMYVSRYTLG